jgi:hypothetical protein
MRQGTEQYKALSTAVDLAYAGVPLTTNHCYFFDHYRWERHFGKNFHWETGERISMEEKLPTWEV